MGSGCGSYRNYGGCPDSSRTSSHCVTWQGETYENLGICTGDTLTEVGETILQKIEQFAQGQGIKVQDLTADCEQLNKELQNTDKTLYSVLKLILNKQCSFDEAVAALQAGIDSLNYNLDYSGVGCTTQSRQQSEQCLIDTVAELKQQVEDLYAQLGVVASNANGFSSTVNNIVSQTLANRITSCNAGIQVSGSGENVALNFVGIVPPGGYLWGEFDITKFDNTGMGTGIYCGYALANGRNGTIDMRNRIPSMAANIQGVPRVFDDLTAIGQVRGADYKLINANQLPSHEHTVIDPGHTHTMVHRGATKMVGKNAGSGEAATDVVSTTSNTNAATTGIQVKGLVGAHGQAFDVRQSTMYQVFIKRVAGFSSVNTQQPIVNLNGGPVGSGVLLNQ